MVIEIGFYFNDKFNKKNKIYWLTYFYITRIIKFIVWNIKGQREKIKIVLEAKKDYNKSKMYKKIF